MIKKIVFFIIGIMMCSYYLMICIIYLNLFKMGFTFTKYLETIICNYEIINLIVGIIFIILSFRKYEYNNDSFIHNIIRRIK